MTTKYFRKPIEDSLQFFLQQQSDELVPPTTKYKEAEIQCNTARNNVIEILPEEYKDSVRFALEKYDESLEHCIALKTEYIYTVAFKEAFRTVIFLLSDTYNPRNPLF